MITSPQNPRVREAAKLRDARARRKQQRIIIDGARELLRAIDSGIELVELFVCDELCLSDDCGRVLQKLADKSPVRRLELLHVTPHVFEKLAFGERSEGVVGVAKMPSRALSALNLPPNPIVAVLEGVEKPGNVGAVLRTADAAGISALVVANGGTDLYNPNAIRASLGAIFTLPVCPASSEEGIEWLLARGLTIYTARVDATTNYTSADFTRPCAIVLGSEAVGLSERWSRPAEEHQRKIIPIRLHMLGRVDSLNVSAAAAILFFEALRQRQLQTNEALTEA